MENEAQITPAGSLDTTTTSQTEVATAQLDEVIGGLFLAFTFKLVAVKTISWAHDD